MRNLKIGKKFLVTFGTIVAVFFITVIVALWGMGYGGSQFQDFYEYSYPLSMKTLEIRKGLQSSIKGLAISMVSDDPAIVNQYLTESQNEIDQIKSTLNYLQQTYRGDTSRLIQTYTLLDEAAQYRTQIAELVKANQDAEAADLFFNHYNPLILEVQDTVISMDEKTTLLADETYESSRNAQNGVFVLALLISASALVITLVLSSKLTRGLKKPIFEIEAAAKQIAEGNLVAHIAYESRDELGVLSDNMRTMVDRVQYYMTEISKATALLAEGDLNVAYLDPFMGDFEKVQQSVRKLVGSLDRTMSQIKQSADQVAAGSKQVSSGSQALSQGAAEQASSIQELSAAVNEISRQSRNTAENAIAAREKTSNASMEVTTCNNQMKEMIEAMEEISQKSIEIGKIIKTIEDIAFQTNILALNAAVEAARAGAAGKGFAVVADEVRNLASKSAEASKNTNALIEGAVQAVEKGTKIADETAESLVRVVESAESIAVIINKIADEANEQASAVDQVTLGITQISGVVQTNSASAEESAAASEELTEQAQMLDSLVSQFKLRSMGQ